MAVRQLLERQIKGESNSDPATIPMRPPQPSRVVDKIPCLAYLKLLEGTYLSLPGCNHCRLTRLPAGPANEHT